MTSQQEQLEEVERNLLDLEVALAQQLSKDRRESAAESIEHCSLQVAIWRLRQTRAAMMERDRQQVADWEAVKVYATQVIRCSKEATEWEKRKGECLKNAIADELDAINKRIDEIEAAGDLLAEIETREE